MTVFKTLSQFYCSSEWKALRMMLIAERADERGILRDEYNGEPLFNSFDIVAHHKIPLTLSNVNDYSISLNPANIMLVSHRSHNEIHQRFGYSKAGRKVYYVYGAPCSGKTSFVQMSKGEGDLVADIDLIWQAISGGELYIKPTTLTPVAFAAYNAILDNIKTRSGEWQRAWIVEGGARQAARSRRIEFLDAEPIYIEASKDDCLNRLHSDPNRKQVQAEWTGYIEKWFEEYQE